MHARSAIFDVYGDLLPDHGRRTTVAALVRLLAPVGIAAPAVRTAVSRMVTQGWLEPVTLPKGRGYAATARAETRYEQAAARVYPTSTRAWDGTWQLIAVTPPPGRGARGRLARELGWLGHAELRSDVWVSPWRHTELDDVLSRCGASAVRATVSEFGPADAPLRAWDLDALATSYVEWLTHVAEKVKSHLSTHEDEDEAAFAARFHLVHEWRMFLFSDPGLPAELLPEDWPGHEAAAYFTAEADRLREGAARFVARALD
ncbi:PaaX family transcriptional regulator [Nocardioides jishulii]|uniref:PaaX family transcriptional regulator n=1 Tax=Nocardioides jishulii TaxID=2575440 RepID=A0A4U2YK28_9ACTN|nr:PaaX family transcriptional regulator C-terminal domain-containing protein [Nocardioides jishulii]QCX26776.1 PaaX family transcriptional regulator [Nocardioides jishulii]TKI61260.1 PaaX family transcriptional regulator [Nocardioides jishulii]